MTKGLVLNSRPIEYLDRFHAVFSEALGDAWRIIDCPVLRMEPVPVTLPAPGAFDALIFTSQAAVAFFPFNAIWRAKRVLAVGRITAKTARDVGFKNVLESGQDVDDLRQYLRGSSFGSALYASGEEVTADLALEFPGKVQRLVVYRASPREDLVFNLDWSGPIIVPLFSRRSAGILTEFLERDLKNAASKPTLAAVGISADVMVDGPWDHRAVADAPTMESVAKAAKRLADTLSPT